MIEEINPIEVLRTIRIFVKKFAASQKSEEPKFTVDVYYKTGEGKGVIAIENAEINAIQRNVCYNLLLKMAETNASTSKEFDHQYDEKVGAVNTKKMIVAMAGIENMSAKAIIAKALHYAQVIGNHEYERIKKELQQKEIFAILE